MTEPGTTRGRAQRWIETGALAAAFVLVAVLSWRNIESVDLGYHLAYGDEVLDHGRIVDSSRFIYTDVAPRGIGGGLDFGAGGWYEPETGRYRFTSPSYGSEIVMSLAHRLGGVVGLCVLRAGLLLTTFALAAIIMARLGVAKVWIAAGLILTALTAYPRFLMRPELFGYALLAGQLLLLLRRRRSRVTGAGIVLLQLVLVQCHSYWVFGIAFTLCFFVEALLRAAWAKWIVKGKDAAEATSGPRWFGTILALQVVAAFVNPWTWRIPALPIQMLSYMREHDIRAGLQATSSHPWARTGELYPTFSKAFAGLRPTYAFCGVLALAGAGGLACVWKRRWAWLALLAGMTLMALNIRRNIAPGAIFTVPIALGALSGLAARGAWRGAVRLAAAMVVIMASAWWTGSVATDRFYYAESRNARFGAGLARASLPIDIAERLPDLPADVRVFTSFDASSTLLYFGRGDLPGGTFRDMPLLTNGWASPPRTMDTVERICQGTEDFAPFARKHNVGIVVAPCLPPTIGRDPLAKKLLRDPNWSPVHMGMRYLLLVRADLGAGPKDWADPARIIAAARRADPSRPAFALNRAAKSLIYLGLWDPAVAVARQSAHHADPRNPRGWFVLGQALGNRGRHKRRTGDPTCTDDFEMAVESFRTVLRLDPDYPGARKNLEIAEQDASRPPRR